jgi:predicted porin
VGDDFTGKIGYTMPWKTVTSVTFDNSQTLRDYGPQSISSLTDVSKKVGISATHRFSQTFGFDFSAGTQLQQSFYLKYAQNPRDRDQVDSNVSLRIDSQPFRKMLANVSVAYSNGQFINIDATQSSDNRTRELWELRPSFTYTINPRLSIIQNYGLSFEYTDYAFKADQNFLDRNITFLNTFQYHPTTRIDLAFAYGLDLHDTGSYLPDPVTGVRLLDVSAKDRRDRTRIRCDYRLTKRVAFFAEDLYSRRVDMTPDNVITGTNTDGQITVGTSGNYDWGAGRYLRFQVARVKRFSPFGAEGEKNYWDAHSEFSYPF